MPPLTDFMGSSLLINGEENIKITKIDVYQLKKSIVLTIKPHRFLDADEINIIKNRTKKIYAGYNVSCICDYRHLELNRDTIGTYSSHVQERLFAGNYISKCLLYKSSWHISDNDITIFTQYGGIYLLEERNCGKKLREIMLEETGKSYNIRFADTSSGKTPEDILRERYEEIASSDPVIEAPPEPKQPMPVPEILPLDNEPVQHMTVIKGKKIDSDITPIAAINGSMNNVTIRGDVLFVETRELKSGRVLVSFAVTDYTSSIKIKMFEGAKADAPDDKKERAKEKLGKITSLLKKDIRVIVNGKIQFDDFDKELVMMGSNINQIEKEEKMDNAPVKRVELHMHSQMSAMDGMTPVKALVSRAVKWGHKAVAITDHGVAQAFPDAFDVARKNKIKMIYGVEGYLRSESLNIVYNVDDDYTIHSSFVVFDLETTGLSPYGDSIIEVGAVKVENGKIIDRYGSFVNPGFPIPHNITQITSITDEMVADAPGIEKVVNEFIEFSKGCVLVAHNANFDVGFMRSSSAALGIEFNYCYVDTLDLCRALFPDLKRHGLAAMVKYLNINLQNHHRAVDDAEATAEILKRCFDMLEEMNIINIDDINTQLNTDSSKKAKNYHIILFAQNKEGLQNLYHIISESHMKYFYKKPVIPRSLINKYRNGILLGSACEAGELYQAVLNGKKQNELEKIASFYDYLEIQPNGNNMFLVRSGRVASIYKLQEMNKRIIELGKKLGKIVVATCDVHFIDPGDEVFRRILMDSQGYEDADKQAPLYFRTTEEMLKEFEYLGEKLAYEVVVENTNKIADMIDEIMLLPDEPHTPKMDGAEEDIVSISTKKAVEIYGDPLPEIVKTRMDRELESIIKHGFSVMYIIAQKLVWKSNADGYLVGSRGSVGSSFIAFLTGITEVNALQPHYVCPNCKHSEFITDGSVGSGMDMEDKLCPKCGALYNKDGHDIPFETFLGFDGDKEPDIDLNFSGDYQPKAHKYTEVLFGEGHVFRAGTIGTVADKTAYGFVKKYFDSRNLAPSAAEINRLVNGCTGVKRTTGQHPGGIMVVPRDEDIHSFCPIQHPADDAGSGIITTHFDYHSISGRLLKLDILGHDDPTVIRMLEDLTGIDAKTIKIGDPETMSIFTSTKALGVNPQQIGSEVGSYGIPEFGTSFVRKMLVDTKPTTFAELVRISGLSHGTDVWLNNAQELVENGTAALKEVICTRDDIMLNLIYMGLPKKDSFKIMESVRKGKGLTEEAEALMRENNVPDWYIDSCKKIKYMFPKAHAAAYVMMAFRIAYFKVHYPKEFYSTYFTVRADEFDASLMTGGYDNIKKHLKEFQELENPSAKEKNVLTILEMCNEMYARGIEFLSIDLYKSHSSKFIPTETGILPPLNALPGLGTSAAESIVEARGDGEFFSVEEFRERTRVSKSVIELMREHHCLDGIPETDQMSLF